MFRKLATLCIIGLALGLALLPAGVGAKPGPETYQHKGKIKIDGKIHWIDGSWDLTKGPLIISYELDLSDAPNNEGFEDPEPSAALVGLVHVAQSGWKGAWLQGFLRDVDNPGVRFPTFPDKDETQDLDDKLYLKRAENADSDEREYDCDCTTKEVVGELGQEIGWDNYGIWFDRDGVDEWQDDMWGAVNGGTYNTGGVYQVQIVYEPASNHPNDRVVACASVNGIQTGFDRQVDGSYSLFPYGLGFQANKHQMKEMQVFVGGNVVEGEIVVRKLTITGYRSK